MNICRRASRPSAVFSVRPALLCALLVLVALRIPPASAAEEILLPTVEAGPGTAAGVPGVLGASDDVRVTGTEADATANLDAVSWLRPNGDRTDAGSWVSSPSDCDVGIGGTAEYECLDESPTNDGNTTILFNNALPTPGNQILSEHDYPSFTPTDVTFDFVTVFNWVRQNGTGTFDFSYGIGDSNANCALIPALTSQGFVNVSDTSVNSCNGSSWTVALVNSAFSRIRVGDGGAQTGTVTSSGLVVQYDDRDQQLALYLNFTNLPSPGGYDYRLEWEASESLASETASLQVLRDGVWTLLAAVPTSESLATYEVQPSEYAGGTARFRIVDDTATEETAESVAVDVFRIVATPRSITDPGANALRVDCAVAPALFRNELRCTATEGFNASIVRARTWYVDGRIVETPDEFGTHLFHDVGPGFVPTAHTWNVTYEVLLADGSVLAKSASATLDTSWLWAAYVLVLLLAGVAGALEVQPRRPRQEPPRRSE